MANIEVSLSNGANTPRRKKGISLGGSSMTLSHPVSKHDQRSVFQDREAIIQNLRVQFNLGNLPRSNGTHSGEVETTELELQKFKNDADNKKIIIRNLKIALENLDITE